MRVELCKIKNVPDIARICYVDNRKPYCLECDEMDESLKAVLDTEDEYTSLFIWLTTDMYHVWGDDWDDPEFPYNAGEPYVRGNNMWLIHIKAFFHREDDDLDSDYLMQKDRWDIARYNNYISKLSVSQINSGMAAWMYQEPIGKSCNGVSITTNNNIHDIIKYFISDYYIYIYRIYE